MLEVWLERLFSSCPLYLREMGYLGEMLGIRRRQRRYRKAWAEHCRRSRQLILAAAQRCWQRRLAVIIGSGWLHDVPWKELARQFQEVHFVDLFHPASVRWHLWRHPKIRLVAADVTGVLEQVWRCGFERRPLPTSTPSLYLDRADLDLTVSLNLLSQLPCMPERYLLACRSPHSMETLAWGRELIWAHLRYLEALPGVVTLITDVEVSSVRGVKNTLFGLPLPYEGETWTWPLVPGKELLQVVGIVDLKQALSRDA